jgi:hypothetical protein
MRSDRNHVEVPDIGRREPLIRCSGDKLLAGNEAEDASSVHPRISQK